MQSMKVLFLSKALHMTELVLMHSSGLATRPVLRLKGILFHILRNIAVGELKFLYFSKVDLKVYWKISSDD